MKENRNYGYALVDIITMLSFVLQIQNNEELYRQASNDDIIENLHKDIGMLYERNSRLIINVLEKEDRILALLEKACRKENINEQEKDKKDD